eukprot:6040938-Pyramimonas_sp.AAC.1
MPELRAGAAAALPAVATAAYLARAATDDDVAGILADLQRAIAVDREDGDDSSSGAVYQVFGALSRLVFCFRLNCKNRTNATKPESTNNNTNTTKTYPNH